MDINQCPICNKAKILKQRHKVSLSNLKTLDYLKKVSSDICGPISLKTYQGYKYFITFLKKKTRFLKITLLKRKSEALQAFKDYKAEVENNSSGKRIQTFSTDNGTEYVNNDFEITLYEFGIKYSRTAPYIKELNGLIERPNRTLLEKVRSLIYQANLPRYLWGEALKAAVYLYNRTPYSSLPGYINPYEAVTGNRPIYNNVKV